MMDGTLYSMDATTVSMIVPDLQIPLHDRGFVEKLISVAEYVKPDKLAFIGDLTDSTEVGRWVKGRYGEYSGKLQAAFDETAQILAAFRAAVGDACDMYLVDSNHDERTKKYIDENAPALSSLRSLDFATLAGLDQASVSYVQGPYPISRDTFLVHGHERASSSVPGKYGLDRAADYNGNVIYGHTHTPLLVTTSVGFGEFRDQRWAMNVGHGMDISKAGYLTDKYATWNQAFGLVHDDGWFTYPELIVAQGGRFSFDGKIW